jgi:NitT/TauT family transport system ATP-binding protein
MAALIEADSLRKVYQPRIGEPLVAIRDATFSLQKGEFVSVVGPSGCGKTTLLHILAGLLPKSGGSLTLNGSPINGPRRDIGVVFQTAEMLPWRNILRNVLVPAEVQHLDRRASERRARELLELVGLTGFEERYPSELSGGMQQRVAIARSLIHDPAILLMDEPFGALDALTREAMNLELQRIWLESGKTILFITHSIPEAVFLADRVLVMGARPSQVEAVVEVSLPRPRGLALLGEERFGQYTTQIRRYFNALSEL